MDYILNLADHYFLDQLYAHFLPYPTTPQSLSFLNTTTVPSPYTTSLTYHPKTSPISLLPRESLIRQSISVFTIAWLGAALLYVVFCSLSYFVFFDKRLMHHPRILPNQIRREIKSSMIAIPIIDLLYLPWFLLEIHGYSQLYEDVDEYGWGYLVGSVLAYLVFTDFVIYWIHRLEHHPRIYKHIHKPHHRWVGESMIPQRPLGGSTV